MFLIAGIIIVSILVVLKFSTTTSPIIEERRSLLARFENEIFANIINELNRTIRLSYYEPYNISTNVFDFGNFTRQKMEEHSIDLTLLYIGILSNKTTNMMNISYVNLYGITVDGNLTLDDSRTDTKSDILDYGRWDTNFTITPGTVYNLTVKYNNTIEYVEIKTKKNKDIYIGFFDLTLKSEDATHRATYQKEINIRK